jgi:hypothetical protein
VWEVMIAYVIMHNMIAKKGIMITSMTKGGNFMVS